MNVAIACGGTGGHLFPGLAVAEELASNGHQILLLISEKEIDRTAVEGRAEFRIEKIPAVGLPRWRSPQVLSFAAKFVRGLTRCLSLFRTFRPQAVLAMGGFTSTAPILAGHWLKVPTFLHESNAIPGKANRLNARFCNRVLLGFAECARYFPRSSVEVTGTPIRSSLRAPVDRSSALASLRLRPELQTLLVMGGSQGARGINQAMLALLPRYATKPVQFIHLAGKDERDTVSEQYRREGLPAYVTSFHHKMEEVYAIADVAVARSGAASLTEISYFGIPSILIPYPFAAENHQLLNAEVFARCGAAEILEESSISENRLSSAIDGILFDPNRRETMHRQMQALTSANSASRIAELVGRAGA
jgi:UDP-N-acetylglucosamine--N-acetylmuramyl-(pentapeptide) pyrophosphoryl-undecaprenol N-acetylglucosamine transferase